MYVQWTRLTEICSHRKYRCFSHAALGPDVNEIRSLWRHSHGELLQSSLVKLGAQATLFGVRANMLYATQFGTIRVYNGALWWFPFCCTFTVFAFLLLNDMPFHGNKPATTRFMYCWLPHAEPVPEEDNQHTYENLRTQSHTHHITGITVPWKDKPTLPQALPSR